MNVLCAIWICGYSFKSSYLTSLYYNKSERVTIWVSSIEWMISITSLRYMSKRGEKTGGKFVMLFGLEEYSIWSPYEEHVLKFLEFAVHFIPSLEDCASNALETLLHWSWINTESLPFALLGSKHRWMLINGGFLLIC